MDDGAPQEGVSGLKFLAASTSERSLLKNKTRHVLYTLTRVEDGPNACAPIRRQLKKIVPSSDEARAEALPILFHSHHSIDCSCAHKPSQKEGRGKLPALLRKQPH
jgi:hypothetical protein